MRKGAVIFALGIGAVLAFFAWSQYSARLEAERSLGLEASRIVSAQFAKKADLRIATLRGKLVASGRDKGFLGLIPSEQMTTIPYTVEYYLNLSKIDHRSYRWDEDSKTLTVAIPDVTVGTPNIDEAAGTTNQKGLFISRRAALALARQTSERAAAKSKQEAGKPENMARARENARVEIAKMSRRPLTAAGLGDIRVAVSFPWEPRDPSASPVEQWDQSRAVEDVLRERQQRRAP